MDGHRPTGTSNGEGAGSRKIAGRRVTPLDARHAQSSMNRVVASGRPGIGSRQAASSRSFTGRTPAFGHQCPVQGDGFSSGERRTFAVLGRHPEPRVTVVANTPDVTLSAVVAEPPVDVPEEACPLRYQVPTIA